MRKHIHGLYMLNGIFCIEHCQVPRLCSGIAAYIYNEWCCNIQQFVYKLFVHTCTWWVSDNYIRPAMLCKKFIIAYSYYIAGEKLRMIDIVQCCIFSSILYGFIYHFNPNNLFCKSTYKN